MVHPDPTIRLLDGPGGPNDTVAPSRSRQARLSLECGHSPARYARRDILLFLCPLVMPHSTTLSCVAYPVSVWMRGE